VPMGGHGAESCCWLVSWSEAFGHPVPRCLVELWRPRKLTVMDEREIEVSATDGPGRDVAELDLAGGSLRVGSQQADVHGMSNAAILRRYVALVRTERVLGPADPVKLRDTDIQALASVLDVDDDDLERDLIAIVGLDAGSAAKVHQRLRRRRLAAPIAGLALGGLGLLGARQWFSGGEATSTPATEISADSVAPAILPPTPEPATTIVTVTTAPSTTTAVTVASTRSDGSTTSDESTTLPVGATQPAPVDVDDAAPGAAPSSASTSAQTDDDTAGNPTSPAVGGGTARANPRPVTTIPAPASDVAMPIFGDAPSISVPPIDTGVDVDPDEDIPLDPVGVGVLIDAEPPIVAPITVTTAPPVVVIIDSDGGISLTP
jgi:hypothetical protein